MGPRHGITIDQTAQQSNMVRWWIWEDATIRPSRDTRAWRQISSTCTCSTMKCDTADEEIVVARRKLHQTNE